MHARLKATPFSASRTPLSFFFLPSFFFLLSFFFYLSVLPSGLPSFASLANLVNQSTNDHFLPFLSISKGSPKASSDQSLNS